MISLNLPRLWRDIEETTNPVTRKDRITSAQNQVTDELENRKREAVQLTASLAELQHHPGSQVGVRLQLVGLRVLALVLLLVDIPAQFLLNQAALPQVELWTIAITAPAIALGMAALVHAGALAFLTDRDRPARAIRLCKTLAGVSFMATAAATAIFLFARQAGPEVVPYIVTLTSGALWTVAEALPLSAGFFSAWAHILAQPAQEAKRLQRVKDRITELERFQEKLGVQTRVVRSSESAPTNGQRELFTPVSRVAGPLLLMLFLGAAFHSVQAQDAPAVCAVFSDRTLSLDSTHRIQAIEQLTSSLPAVLSDMSCTAVLVGSFADEGLWAPRQLLEVPTVPISTDCSTADTLSVAGVSGLLTSFKGFREHFVQAATIECEEAIQRAQESHQDRGQMFLGAIREALLTPQLTEETETNILGLLESLEDSRVRLTVLVTDGLETVGELPPTRISVPLVLILVPAQEHYGGASAAEVAAAQWEEAGAFVVPSSALSSPLWWRGIVP